MAEKGLSFSHHFFGGLPLFVIPAKAFLSSFRRKPESILTLLFGDASR